jgi:four helix bundle protein
LFDCGLAGPNTSKIKNQKSTIKNHEQGIRPGGSANQFFCQCFYPDQKYKPTLPDYRFLLDQVRRSATSPALNYGEAQSAESTNDFIHKLGIVIKELRETHNALRILFKWGCIPPENGILAECNDLIAIFVSSVKTAQRNRNQKSKINNKK